MVRSSRSRPTARHAAWLVTLTAGLLAPPAAAQQLQAFGRAASVTIGGRIHPQYTISSIDGADNDFFLRRARLDIDLRVSDFLSGRIMPEFAGGVSVRDAYATLAFSDELAVTVGQFKRTFDPFWLAASYDLPLIERDGRVEGYGACAVGSVCTYGRMIDALQLGDRDQGIRLAGASGRFAYMASLTNGTGANTSDENDAKTVMGRGTFDVNEDVRVSGLLALHDYVDPDGNASAVTWGGDVEVGTWRDGLHVMGALIGGENWQALDATNDPATFLAAQGMVSYHYPIEAGRFVAVEPLGRVSFADPDRAADDDGGVLITPGVGLYISGRNWIEANFDIYSPQAGDKEFSFKVQTFLFF